VIAIPYSRIADSGLDSAPSTCTVGLSNQIFSTSLEFSTEILDPAPNYRLGEPEYTSSEPYRGGGMQQAPFPSSLSVPARCSVLYPAINRFGCFLMDCSRHGGEEEGLSCVESEVLMIVFVYRLSARVLCGSAQANRNRVDFIQQYSPDEPMGLFQLPCQGPSKYVTIAPKIRLEAPPPASDQLDATPSNIGSRRYESSARTFEEGGLLQLGGSAGQSGRTHSKPCVFCVCNRPRYLLPGNLPVG